MSDYQTSGRDEFLRAQEEQHRRTLGRLGMGNGPSAENVKYGQQRDAQMREERARGRGERTPNLSLSEQALQRRVDAQAADPMSGTYVAAQRWHRMFGGR